MSYFNYLPVLEYFNSTTIQTSDLVGSNIVGAQKNIQTGIELTNIFVRYKVRNAVLAQTTTLYPYMWQDGDRPDTIANTYYGDPGYWWVVMYSNQSFDLNMDLPLSYQRFRDYLIRKYVGLYYPSMESTPDLLTAIEKQTIIDNLQSQILYYQTTDGLIIDETAYNAGSFPGSIPVYVYDRENTINDAKRSVKLLDRTYLTQLVNEFQAEAKVRRYRGR